MQDYLSLAIVGAVVSVLVQFIKQYTGTAPLGTRLTVIGLSVVAGAIYWAVRDTALWQSGLQVLVFANAVYAFLIRPTVES